MSVDGNPDPEEKSHRTKIIIFIVFLLLLWLLVTKAVWSFAQPTSPYIAPPDYSVAGTIGDSFGAVNALFSAFALAGVIYAVILQTTELRYQRREMTDSRKAAEKSAEAQTEQTKVQSVANELKCIDLALSGLAARIDSIEREALTLETQITQRITQANMTGNSTAMMVNESWNEADRKAIDGLKTQVKTYKIQRIAFEKSFIEIQQKHYDLNLPEGFVSFDEAISAPVDPLATGGN